MKKALLFLLLLFGCVILLGVLLVVFLIHVSKNQVMDGPGMENRSSEQGGIGMQSSANAQGSNGTQGSINTQSSIGMQGEEGEKRPAGTKQGAFADYDGTWYNRDKSVKLVIQKGFVKGYRLAEGSYQVMFT